MGLGIPKNGQQSLFTYSWRTEPVGKHDLCNYLRQTHTGTRVCSGAVDFELTKINQNKQNNKKKGRKLASKQRSFYFETNESFMTRTKYWKCRRLCYREHRGFRVLIGQSSSFYCRTGFGFGFPFIGHHKESPCWHACSCLAALLWHINLCECRRILLPEIDIPWAQGGHSAPLPFRSLRAC